MYPAHIVLNSYNYAVLKHIFSHGMLSYTQASHIACGTLKWLILTCVWLVLKLQISSVIFLNGFLIDALAQEIMSLVKNLLF